MDSPDPLERWRRGVACPDAAATEAAGAALAALLPAGAALLLEGDLGAGKTTFARGLARGLGVAGDITSPSYALVQVHPGRPGRRMVHVDAYRLTDPRQAEGLLLDEIAEPGDLLVIEWPERLGDRAPTGALRLRLTATEAGGRLLKLV